MSFSPESESLVKELIRAEYKNACKNWGESFNSLHELLIQTCSFARRLGKEKITISKQLYEELEAERKQNPYIDFQDVKGVSCLGVKIEVTE